MEKLTFTIAVSNTYWTTNRPEDKEIQIELNNADNNSDITSSKD